MQACYVCGVSTSIFTFLEYKPEFLMQDQHELWLCYIVFLVARNSKSCCYVAIMTYTKACQLAIGRFDIIQNMNDLLRATSSVLPIITSQPLNVK